MAFRLASNNVKDIKGREIISSFNISRIEKRRRNRFSVGAGVDDLRDRFYPGAQKIVFIGEGEGRGRKGHSGILLLLHSSHTCHMWSSRYIIYKDALYRVRSTKEF